MITAKLKAMAPVLAVDNIEHSIAYYKDKLGFKLSWVWGEPTVRASLEMDGFELQLDASGSGPVGISVVYCHMCNINNYYEFCIQNGADIELELGDRVFKVRGFRVLYPNHFKVQAPGLLSNS